MKRIAIIVMSFFLICRPSITLAQTTWEISEFHSDITIEKTGSVHVVEKITVDFYTTQKHGIYREIPYVYQSNNDEKKYTTISDVAVLRDSHIEKYREEKNNNNIRILIGDPNKTIDGKHIYEISYIVKGVLVPYDTYDELYWNVTGSSWEIPIQKASAVLTLPFPGLHQTACYFGKNGSSSQCRNEKISEKQGVFSTDTVYPGENFTIAAGYSKGLVPILTVPKPKTFLEELLQPSIIALYCLTTALGIGIIVRMWLKNGRDFWKNNNPFLQSSEGSIKPIGAHETVVVEFTPPDNIRPAEMGVLMDERADTLDISATIIDLAQKGLLVIEEVKKIGIFGKIDYIFKKTENKKTLLAYESLLLEKLFKNKSSVKLSELKFSFYKDLSLVKTKLYERIVERKMFFDNPEVIRKKYLITGILLACLPIFSLFVLGGFFVSPSMFAVITGIATCGITLVGFSSRMPKRTADGRELYRRSLGYKMFISGAEKYRQQFFENNNLFTETLPYAIIFGLSEKFAKAMKDIGIEPKEPKWYRGSSPFAVMSFTKSIDSFSNTLSSAIAATPTKSGSSGGGSSGGGFGGGGGGSW